MSGMRTVSFFGPKEGGIGGRRIEADNGRVAAGGFLGGKKFVDETSSGADCGEDGTGGAPVSRTGNWIRTLSRGFTLGSGGFAEGGTGNSMRTVSFFGWSGSAIGAATLIRNCSICHYQILEPGKICLC